MNEHIRVVNLSAAAVCSHVRGGADDVALVARAADGDGDAFALLYGRFKKSVWELSYYMLRDRHDAEDATQQTFVKAWQRLSRFRATGTLKSWLLSICRNVCIDRLRCRSRAMVSLDSLTEAELTCCVSRIDLLDRVALRIVLEELPKDECEAWFLVDVLGCSSEEAALVVGVRAASTMRSRVARARSQLASALGRSPDAGPAGARNASICGLYHSPPEKAIVAALAHGPAAMQGGAVGVIGRARGRVASRAGHPAGPAPTIGQSGSAGMMSFFDQLERAVPRGPRIVVLVERDQVNATERWRACHARWELLRVPSQGSWREEAERLLARCAAGAAGQDADLGGLLALIDAGEPFVWTHSPERAFA